MKEVTGTLIPPSGNFSRLHLAIRERNWEAIRVISYMDVCSIAVNGIAMMLMLFIVYNGTAKRKKKLNLHTDQSDVKESDVGLRPSRSNQLHSFRTIMLLILSFMWSLSVGEALIRWVFSTVTLSTLIIVSPVLSFMTSLSAIAFYNFIESSGSSSSLFVIPIVLWVAHISFVSANVYKVIYILCVGAVSVAPSLNVSILLLLNVLLICDVSLYINEIYSKCKRKSESTNGKAKEDSQPLKFLSKSCLKSSEKSPDFVNNFGENFPKLIRPLQDHSVTFVPSSSRTLEREPEVVPEGAVKRNLLRYTHNESSFISRCSFWWYLKILRQGWKIPLEYSDLDKIPAVESSHCQYQKLWKKYDSAAKKYINGSPSLWFIYLSCYWKSLLLGGILKFLGDAVNIVGPLSIAPVVNFVKSIQEGTLSTDGQFRDGEYFIEWNEYVRNGWILAWIALVASLLQSTFSQASSHIMVTEGIHVRSSLQAMVYSKSLRRADLTCCINEDVRKEMRLPRNASSSSTAVIINLATEDAENILSFFLHCHYIWAIPLKVSALVAILWMQLGISAIYSSALAILILIPVQFLLAKCISSVNKKFVDASDDRLLKTQEFISFIRTIKANVWQNIFMDNVFKARGAELTLLLKDSLLRACMTFLTQASGIVIILLAFGFYALIHDQSPDEGTVFSSLALFSQLTVPLFILPLIVAYTIKAKRSTIRLESFLSEPEVTSSRKVTSEASRVAEREKPDPTILELNNSSTENQHYKDSNDEVRNDSTISKDEGDIISGNFEIARITKGYFGLRRESHNFIALEDINLSIPKGKLTIVVGDVGSGKSSLLLALLEEIPQISGNFSWNGGSSVAFVSQTPWLLNCSLKENILFFKGFHRQRYEKVLRAVALTPDIQILPDGDDTEIGERGINLSGGQRQRVVIARALYSEVPVIVMDCPFSSLDTNVSSHVFQEGILDFLLKERKTTVVMATQHQHFCQYADKIVYLQDKTIHCQGTPAEIIREYHYIWNQMKSPPLLVSTFSNLSVPNIWKERNSLKRHVSRMNLQYSISRKSLHGSNFEEDINEMFLRTLPLRHKHSFARSSPFHAALPADEIEALHTRTLTRKKRLRPTKPPAFRTASSTPAFGRTEEDLPLRETSIFDRHSSKSFSAIPKRHKSLPSNHSRASSRVKRESSVFRKLVPLKSIKNTEKLKRRSTRSRWSLKRFLSTEDENKELDDSGYENNEAEGSEDEFYEALIDEEERERGRISKKNYLAYIQACGWGIGLFYLLSSFVNQGASVALDIWLGLWSTDNAGKKMNLTNDNCGNIFNKEIEGELKFLTVNLTVHCEENNTVHRYLFIFTLLSGMAVMVGFLTICLAQIAAHRGRRLLFQKLFSSVVGSRVKFFDVTPIGRILNRFSSDTSMIDKELGWSIVHLVFFALLCSSAILVNAFISPIFVIATIPVCLIYYFIQHVFRCTSRELKRLESLSRSPILGLISETAISPTVIRAYGAEEKFFSSYFKRLDTYLGSSILLHAGNRWLGISLDYMGSIIVFLSMIACLIGSTVNVGNFLTPAMVGLAIKYTLTIPVYLNWLVRFLSDTEMCLNSVERVRQYSSLSAEANAAESDSNSERKCYQKMRCSVKKCKCRMRLKKNHSCSHKKTTPDIFPVEGSQDDGRIEFKGVNLYYDRACEPVVFNLSFAINPGQKVGICGRTGSGKSSVLQGILGMVDFHEGNILLNGIDTDDIPLDQLRKSLSVVLQEDCIFQGNVRFQMDPENKYQDELLWNALELVFLKDFVSSLPNKLYTEIGSGIFTLSSGQIQLLTLSRVILAKSPFVLLDEVTSSLDLQLERKVLDMLRRELPHSTILHVTHSVPCLLESDLILVLHKGELIEDGPPQELLKDKRGRFTSLLKSLNKYP